MLDEGEAHLAVFFDHEMPSDNGVAAALSAYPDDLLDATYGRPPGTFAALPHFGADVLLSPPSPDGGER